jgi:L-alanine-DL-glutamate epimerase-like enolase superfamily enzyme
MKISGVEAFPVAGRLFVVVDVDDGTYGVGECGLPSEHRAVVGTLAHVEPRILGADPFRSEHLWQVLARSLFFPTKRVLSSVIAGVDMALWDLKGKALGVPVHDLLGGRVREHVPCYTHIVGGTGEIGPVVDSALAAIESGWRYVRWGLPTQGDVLEPRRSVRAAIEQFAAVRDAVGPDVELILDVHTRLDPANAVTLCREVEALRPFFIEDPLRAENPRSYEMLRLRTGVPLAAGEQFGSKWEFRELIENDWIDYARIDLGVVGGITEARKIAGWCETHYIDIAMHNPLGPVATAASLHFNLACPNMAVQEQAMTPGELGDVVGGQPTLDGGNLLPTDRPGFGLTFDRDAARRIGGSDTLTPRLHRPDGSVTNW